MENKIEDLESNKTFPGKQDQRKEGEVLDI